MQFAQTHHGRIAIALNEIGAQAREIGMQVDDRLGRIEVGFDADLVLLEADPTRDISATRAIETVVLRGRTVLHRADLRSLLETVERP